MRCTVAACRGSRGQAQGWAHLPPERDRQPLAFQQNSVRVPKRRLANRFCLCYRHRQHGFFPGSSVVEQATVNRLVAGSNPARGARSTRFCFKRNRVFLCAVIIRRVPEFLSSSLRLQTKHLLNQLAEFQFRPVPPGRTGKGLFTFTDELASVLRAEAAKS